MNYMFESLVLKINSCEYVLWSKVTNSLDDEIFGSEWVGDIIILALGTNVYTIIIFSFGIYSKIIIFYFFFG
jgi:hypothetical protein